MSSLGCRNAKERLSGASNNVACGDVSTIEEAHPRIGRAGATDTEPDDSGQVLSG